MHPHRMTIIDALVFEAGESARIRKGSVTFADGMTFRFVYDSSDGFVVLRRDHPHPKSRGQTVRVSSPHREAAIRRYASTADRSAVR